MAHQHIGYLRVSSIDQNEDRQLADLNMELHETFIDKCSGSSRDRPQLKACIKHLRKGDTLHVHSIDRLARNLADLQDIVSTLVKRGVSVKFHSEGLTFSDDSDPMKLLMLQMLGAFSQFERSLIRSRQKEGIEAARKKGVKLGRRSALSDSQVEEIKAKASQGVDKSTLAKEYGVSRPSIYRALQA